MHVADGVSLDPKVNMFSTGTDDREVGSPARVTSLVLDVVEPAGDEVAVPSLGSIGRVHETVKQIRHRRREGEERMRLLRGEAEGRQLQRVAKRLTEQRKQTG